MDLNFNGLKHICLGDITYDNILNTIKLMIDSSDRSKMNMHWKGYSLYDNDKGNKIGSVMFMNNPKGGNQQGGNYQGANPQGIIDKRGNQQNQQGGEQDGDQGNQVGYTGPSRITGGEPTDIPELYLTDKKRLVIFFKRSRKNKRWKGWFNTVKFYGYPPI